MATSEALWDTLMSGFSDASADSKASEIVVSRLCLGECKPLPLELADTPFETSASGRIDLTTCQSKSPQVENSVKSSPLNKTFSP